MKKLLILLPALLLFFLLPAVSCGETEDPAPGDVILFGAYPQTASGTDCTPVEWIVLDVRDGKYLLLSRRGLDVRPFHPENLPVTWEASELRAWLNGEFLETAFSEEERAAILLTEVDNSAAQSLPGWNVPGENNTEDRVFLLSYAEAHQYLQLAFHDPEVTGTRSRLAPTAYARENGAWTTDEILTQDGWDTGWWLLRSPGPNESLRACVNCGGGLSDCPVTLHTGCIRPMLWMNPEVSGYGP